MKNIFKFAAMAFAAVAMFAACEPEDKGNEKDALPTPDGKQWVVSGYMPMVYDFGVTEENVITQGYAMEGMYYKQPFPLGENYTVTPKDATSGSITYETDGETGVIELTMTYENLTEDSVTFKIPDPWEPETIFEYNATLETITWVE